MQQQNTSAINRLDLQAWHELHHGKALDFNLVKPLNEKLYDTFELAVKQLTRPYLAISQEDYDKVFAVTKNHGDIVLYDGIKMTFGNADGGFALMPLSNEFQDEVSFVENDVDESLAIVDWHLEHGNDSSQNRESSERQVVDFRSIAFDTAMAFFLADVGDHAVTKSAILNGDEKPDDVFVVERFEYDPWDVVCNSITELSDEIEGAFQQVLLKLKGDSDKTKRFLNQLLKANSVENLEVVDLGEQVVFNKRDLDPNYSR